MKCKKCGRELENNAKFCSYCGCETDEPETEISEKDRENKAEETKRDFEIEAFNWNLEGFPSAGTGKTEDIDFNWDSVLEKKKADTGYNEPISFGEKKEPKDEEFSFVSKEEKYTLSDLFKDDRKDSVKDKESSENLTEESTEEEKNEDIMELSFEDELFDDVSPDKPASATIRISQTIHFTDQFYSFDNKHAEYQSVLDEEYNKLQNGEEDFQEEEKEELPETEAAETEAEVSDEPEIRTGIASDDFLKELYGDEAAEAAEPAEAEEAGEPAEKSEENAEQEGNSEEEPEAAPAEEETETEPAEESEPASEDNKEQEEEAEEPEAQDEDLKETAEEADEDVNKVITIEESAEETYQADADEEILHPELVGVSLARTPRGVLIIEKNSKEKLTRRTEFPSSSKDESEEDKEQCKEGTAESAEGEKSKKLSFGDVFNDSDDVDYVEKPSKKRKTLKVIAVILCILVVAELAVIGIQYFAPDSVAAEKIDYYYGQLLGKLDPEKKENKEINEEHITIASPLEEYAFKVKNSFEGISELKTDTELIFGEDNTYEFTGYEKAGTFEDSEWYTDDEGHTVMYGEAVVKGIAGYYSSLVDYKNGKNEEIFTKITADSSLSQEIYAYEIEKDVVSAINMLTLGEIKTSEDGIYLMVSVEYADSRSSEVTVEKNAVMLKPENQEMKVDSIIKL